MIAIQQYTISVQISRLEQHKSDDFWIWITIIWITSTCRWQRWNFLKMIVQENGEIYILTGIIVSGSVIFYSHQSTSRTDRADLYKSGGNPYVHCWPNIISTILFGIFCFLSVILFSGTWFIDGWTQGIIKWFIKKWKEFITPCIKNVGLFYP